MASRTKAQWAVVFDSASNVALKFVDNEAPPLANEGIQQLIDDAGAVNAAINFLKKAEAALKEQLKSRIRNGELEKQASGERFKFDMSVQDRTALDQTFAKDKLRALGVPDSDFMVTTGVETMRFSDV